MYLDFCFSRQENETNDVKPDENVQLAKLHEKIERNKRLRAKAKERAKEKKKLICKIKAKRYEKKIKKSKIVLEKQIDFLDDNIAETISSNTKEDAEQTKNIPKVSPNVDDTFTILTNEGFKKRQEVS